MLNQFFADLLSNFKNFFFLPAFFLFLCGADLNTIDYNCEMCVCFMHTEMF